MQEQWQQFQEFKQWKLRMNGQDPYLLSIQSQQLDSTTVSNTGIINGNQMENGKNIEITSNMSAQNPMGVPFRHHQMGQEQFQPQQIHENLTTRARGMEQRGNDHHNRGQGESLFGGMKLSSPSKTTSGINSQ